MRPVFPGPARPRPHPTLKQDWRADEKAHLLAISGVILVLGFLTLGSTLVLVNNLEADTIRGQTGIHKDAHRIMSELNATLNRIMDQGTMEVAYYHNISASLEKEAQQQAAEAGFYASIRLTSEPSTQAFHRPGRCLGYDPDASTGGVIIGWEDESRQRGIAGAVYEVHMTDGRETLRTDYYVKFFDCLKDVVHTHIEDHKTAPGSVQEMALSRAVDAQAMRVEETTHRTTLEDLSPVIDESSFEVVKWNHPRNLTEQDDQTAKFPNNEAQVNHIQWRLDAPERMQADDILFDTSLLVVAHHEYEDPPEQEQDLVLNIYYPADADEPWHTQVIGPLQRTPSEHEFPLLEGPTGMEGWTREDIEDTLWELTVIGDHNPDRTIHVDAVQMTGDLWTHAPWEMDVVIEWEQISGLYEHHGLMLDYRIDPGTPGEQFELWVRESGPGGNASWWRLTGLEDTNGEWATFTMDLELVGDQVKELEFRLLDTHDADVRTPEDGDVVMIDRMRVTSRLPGTG